MKSRFQYANYYDYRHAKRRHYLRLAGRGLLLVAALAFGFWLGFHL